MQSEIDPVVAGRMSATSKDRVVEEVRERGQRAVNSAHRSLVPIILRQDEIDVVWRGGFDARILQNQRAIVEYEACSKGIGVREEREGAENQ
jgi:hypothetical protein